ncbi:MAG: class II aldolase/adducin family protein [Bacteroidetes bacterium]|nr:class II aldolase/adducin family protein [Bacteroidota bacterium]
MPGQEGAIRFNLQFEPTGPINEAILGTLAHWRQRLMAAGLVGQDPDRYDGYGFGNLSCRVRPFNALPSQRAFIITGSQTGYKQFLTGQDYSHVHSFDLAKNLVNAHGPTHPSSESLTHGAVYMVDPSIRWVFHVHSQLLWKNAKNLHLPITQSNIPQGTPEMAYEVARLFETTAVLQTHIFAMGGHEDGMVAIGRTAEEAGNAVMHALKQVTSRGGGI